MKLIPLICLTFVLLKCVAIDIDDINLSNCTSGADCDDAINTDIGISNSTGNANSFNEEVSYDSTVSFTTEIAINTNATTTNSEIVSTSLPPTTMSSVGSTINTVERKIGSNTENHSDICTCDVTVTCDINCCCDADCNQSSVSFHHGYHQPKIYNSRYCYTKNFIHRNNTPFILERLASNLFCIAYDNLPPIYGIRDSLDIKDRKAFEDAKYASNPMKYSWDWHNEVIPPEFNMSSHYHNADSLWKFHKNIVTPMELPQSGFTGECKLRKIVKYREPSKWSCMQTDLSNSNAYLFTEAYENFTVISSPDLFNLSRVIAENHTCPNTSCVKVRSLYCGESRSSCNSVQSLEQSCLNRSCRNVVKRLHYTIVLNSECGIQSIEIRFEFTNASQSFYQYFEVTFEGSNGTAGKIFPSSRSHGYIVGNPIIKGATVRNNSNNVITEYPNISKSDAYLTVALRKHNGDCDERERYVIEFAEDVRLRCSVKLKTDKFSSDSCVELQNQTLKYLLDDAMLRAIETEKYTVFVSKTGDISKNETANWTQILLDRIAPHVVTGQIYGSRIRCSGLITSININILYTILPTFETPARYTIAGVSVTFSEPIDVFWPKCIETNCTDILPIALLSFVSFTEVSTPSMYYYAGGPNLDISLPYDFFYPFMSGTDNAKPVNLFVQSISIIFSFSFFKFV